MWHSSNNFMTRSGNEARLTIREVKDTDAGVYECNAGSVCTKATVTVKGSSSCNIICNICFSAQRMFSFLIEHSFVSSSYGLRP